MPCHYLNILSTVKHTLNLQSLIDFEKWKTELETIAVVKILIIAQKNLALHI